jgi:uncharacterized membrane protein
MTAGAGSGIGGASPAGGGLATGRIEALCDGVFAIVFTLLILDLHVPEVADAAARAELPARLAELWPKALSYMVTFVVLGVYWTGHQVQYLWIKRSDRIFLWINILFLMCVAFVPFSAALLGRYWQQQIAVVIYGLNLIVVGLVVELHWWYATRDHRLVDQAIDPQVVRMATRRILTSPAIYLAAIALSRVDTRLSLALYCAGPLVNIIPGRIDRHFTLGRGERHHS